MNWQTFGFIFVPSAVFFLSAKPAGASLTCFAMNDPSPEASRFACVAIGRVPSRGDRIETGVYRSFRLPQGAAVWPGGLPTTGSEWTAWTSIGGDLRSSLSCVLSNVSQVDCFGVGTDGSLFANYYADAAGGPSGRRSWTSLGMPPDGEARPYAGGRARVTADPSCLPARGVVESLGIVVPAVRCFTTTNTGSFAVYDYRLQYDSRRRHLPERHYVGTGNWYWLGRPSLLSNPSCVNFDSDTAWCFGVTSTGLVYREFRDALSSYPQSSFVAGAWSTVNWSSLGNPKPRPSRIKCVTTGVGGLDLPSFSQPRGEAACFFPNSPTTVIIILNTFSDGRLEYTRAFNEPSLNSGIRDCIYTSNGALACLSPRGPGLGIKVVTFQIGRMGTVESTTILDGTRNQTMISCAKSQISTRPTIDCVASEIGNPDNRMANYRLDAGSWRLIPDSIPGGSGEPPSGGAFQLYDQDRF